MSISADIKSLKCFKFLKNLTNEKIADFVGRIRICEADCITLEDIPIDDIIEFELTDKVIPVDCFNNGRVP